MYSTIVFCALNSLGNKLQWLCFDAMGILQLFCMTSCGSILYSFLLCCPEVMYGMQVQNTCVNNDLLKLHFDIQFKDLF